jgi:predicted porin
MGIMFSGGTGEKKFFGLKAENIFGYQFAILNGEGRNKLDVDNRKSYVGRLTFHPFDFITIGSSYRHSKLPSAVESKEEDDYGTRLGYELKAEYANVFVSGEYITGKDVGSYTTGGGCSGLPLEIHEGSVERQGYYASLLYKTPWNLEPLVKYEYFQSYNPDLDEYSEKNSTITFGLNYFFNEWTRLQVNYLYNAEGLKEIPNDALLIQVQAVIK